MHRYNNLVQHHYDNPKNIGEFDTNSQDIGTGIVGSPACGDMMQLQLHIVDDHVHDVRQKTFGCPSAIAASSLLIEYIIGVHIDDILDIKNTDLSTKLDLPPNKIHCSVLAVQAIRNALDNYRSKHPELKREAELFNIKMTDSAYAKLSSFILEYKFDYIKIDIINRGCAGNGYKIYGITKNDVSHNDQVTSFKDLSFVCNNRHVSIMNKMTIDYMDNGLESEIIFDNPNEVIKCPCGISFNTDINKQISQSCCKK